MRCHFSAAVCSVCDINTRTVVRVLCMRCSASGAMQGRAFTDTRSFHPTNTGHLGFSLVRNKNMAGSMKNTVNSSPQIFTMLSHQPRRKNGKRHETTDISPPRPPHESFPKLFHEQFPRPRRAPRNLRSIAARLQPQSNATTN